MWEPFNRQWGLRDVRTVYPYLRHKDAGAPPVTTLARYLETGRALWSVKESTGGSLALRRAAKSGQAYLHWLQGRSRIPLIKDPFALLAMGALQPTLTRRTIVVSVRHPCSWVLSLRRMGWAARPELNALIRQEELYEEHLSGMLARRDWKRAGDLEAGATAWACLYHMVGVQRRAGTDARVVPLEAFGRDPVGTLKLLYGAVQLTPPTDLELIAERYSRDSTVTPDSGTKHLLQRDSRALSEAWKSKLTAEEVRLIRTITEPVYSTIYSDWETAESA